MKPYILFYSNKCEYSADVLKRVTTTPSLNQQFMYVNIDNKTYQLPPFVDRVPLIYIKNSKEAVIDENVVRFLDSLSVPPTSGGRTEEVGTRGDLESLSDMSKSISSSFSFIQEGDDNITPLSYGLLGGHEGFKNGNGLNMEDKKEDAGRTGNKIDSALFDAYKNQRDMDDASFQPRRSPKTL